MNSTKKNFEQPSFGEWDERRAFTDWTAFTEQTPDLDQVDVDKSMQFLASCYDEFEGRVPLDEASHAFIVPTRLSATTERWADDTNGMVPMFRTADPATRVALLSRLPPFIIDRYVRNGSHQNPGVVIFCPIFPDMGDSMTLTKGTRLARNISERTLDFAATTGCVLAGLGGVLPSLTHYGQRIRTPVPTTSGHGGTLALLRATLTQALLDGSIAKLTRAAVVGGGAIGTSIAIDLAHLEAEVQLVDTSPKARALAQRRIAEDGTTPSGSIKVVAGLSQADTIDLLIGAATSTIDVSGLSTDAVVIDDSQPPCVEPDVKQELRWVVGSDMSTSRIATRTHYLYGIEGLVSPSDVWGCEAEVAALVAAEATELRVTKAVTPETTSKIGEVLETVGIKAATPQAFGRPLTNSTVKKDTNR